MQRPIAITLFCWLSLFSTWAWGKDNSKLIEKPAVTHNSDTLHYKKIFHASAFAPEFTLSTNTIIVDEDFEGEEIINITPNPDNDTPFVEYSINEVTSPDFADVEIIQNEDEVYVRITSVENENGGPIDIEVTATDVNDDTNTFSAAFSLQVSPVNDIPTVANTIDNITVDENAEPSSIDISNVFSDVDDEELSITASSDNTDLVQASINGNSLTLTFSPEASGQANI
ncbi:hypothetical protein WJR50_11910, partial [Catalinimonas sp. 4WD22]|uniref:hypothetical protein n=1 Tax=Catalinimonas locisalis TaxID=3133978 RepID=UPI0031012E79